MSVIRVDFKERRRIGAHLRLVHDEQRVQRELYPDVPVGHVSRSVPVAWHGIAPILLAEFQVGEFDGAA
jgi:hypothetical protein